MRHPRCGFEFYWAPILPPKPKAIARNVPPTPRAKGPPAPATPSLQGICENLPQLPISMAHSLALGTVAHLPSSPPLAFPLYPSSPPKATDPKLLPLRRIPSHRICYPFDESRPTGSATTSTMAHSPDLPPLRRIPSHRLCYNIDDGRLTGSATPSTNPIEPDMLHSRRPVPPHQI